MMNRKKIALICIIAAAAIALIVSVAEFTSSYKYEDMSKAAEEYAAKQGIEIESFSKKDKLAGKAVCAICADAIENGKECAMVFYFTKNGLFKNRLDFAGTIKGKTGEINAKCVLVDNEPRFFVFGADIDEKKREAYIPGMRRMVEIYYDDYVGIYGAHSSYWHSEDW